MKVLVMIKANKESEAGAMPSQQLITEMMQFNEELVKAGVLLAAEGLHPSSKGVRVSYAKGGKLTVVDGPFAETKELLAGYWLWQVKSMDEAIAWVKRCPNPDDTEGDIEIRPVFEMGECGEAFTPELREQEKRILAAAEKLKTP
ncbi:MAG: YciI family protein [Gemmataceae bacterium]|nr:YciI family protein [Gemmataceae bacterium]